MAVSATLSILNSLVLLPIWLVWFGKLLPAANGATEREALNNKEEGGQHTNQLFGQAISNTNKADSGHPSSTILEMASSS